MALSPNARALSVRLPGDLQNKLLATSVATGLSVSQLLREGADMVVERHLGDPTDVERAVQAAERRTAERVRVLLGTPSQGASYEATRELLSFVIAELSRRVDGIIEKGQDAGDLEAERSVVIDVQRQLDPTAPGHVARISEQYGQRAAELRLVRAE